MDFAWTAVHTDVEGTRDSGDPLGFRAYATRLARRVVPGLTQASHLTRGFSVLCLGLDVVRSIAPPHNLSAREIFLRTERLWVGAEVLAAGNDAYLSGQRRAARLLESSDDFRLDVPLLTDQFSGGVWGSYRRAALAFGLVDGGARVSDCWLTSRGAQLADVLRGLAGGIQINSWVKKGFVPKEKLELVVAADHTEVEETTTLSNGMTAFDRHVEQALCRLRTSYDQDNLMVGELATARMGTSQRSAVEAGRALVDAIEMIEFPFRRWIAGGATLAIPAKVWALPIWSMAAADQETDLVNLHQLGSGAGSSGGANAVMRHHRWLSTARGAPEWRPGFPESAVTEQLPDFTLSALRHLFFEGVEPCGTT